MIKFSTLMIVNKKHGSSVYRIKCEDQKAFIQGCNPSFLINCSYLSIINLNLVSIDSFALWK